MGTQEATESCRVFLSMSTHDGAKLANAFRSHRVS